MPEDSFKYRVELDTQGLAAQLAGVRDVVAGGLSQAARGFMGAADVAVGATNRLTSDLMMGQQMVASAMPAQLSPMLPPMGVARTTLANVPGMPQSFTQEMMAATGLTRAPVGVFPSQFQAIARERLAERAQMGVAGTIQGAVSIGAGQLGGMAGGALAGALTGAAAGSVVPVIGTIAGAIAGGLLGDAAMAPLMDNVQARMMERARIHQIFGFNKFKDDERSTLADFMRTQFTKSILSPDDFNAVLPAAARGGFFRGVGRNDVQGFQNRFTAAQQSLTEDMFALQLNGPEGMMQAGELRRGFRRMGVGDPDRVSRHFRQARVLAQDMMELGEFVDPMEIVQQQLSVGHAAFQFGISPQAGMNVFARQASMVNGMIADRRLTEDDLAMLGGTSGEAAQRLTMSLIGSQRQPIFRAMAMAFGQADAVTGKAGVNQAALEAVGAGRMSFSAMSERLSQQIGTGMGGTSKILTLMANQGKIQGEMLQNQGAMLNGLTDDILRQANMEVNEGTRQFVMQRVFGIGEAESRALMRGLPMEEADAERLEKDGMQLDREVKGAISTAQTGLARDFDRTLRELKDTLGKPLSDMSHAISRELVPSNDRVVEELRSLNERVSQMPRMSTFDSSRVPVMTGLPEQRMTVAR